MFNIIARANRMTDISGIPNIKELRVQSAIKKCVKLIPRNKTIHVEEFKESCNFIHLDNIVKDDEVFASGEKQGKKNTTPSLN